MRIIWVALLAIIAFVVGGFGAMAWKGATGSIAGIRIACTLLDTAESGGYLTKEQRGRIVDSVGKQLQEHKPSAETKLEDFVREFKTGCPNLPNFGRKS